MRGPHVACTASNYEVYVLYLILSLKERVTRFDHIIERPNLTPVSMPAEHYINTGVRGSFNLPRSMGKQDGCALGAVLERL